MSGERGAGCARGRAAGGSGPGGARGRTGGAQEGRRGRGSVLPPCWRRAAKGAGPGKRRGAARGRPRAGCGRGPRAAARVRRRRRSAGGCAGRPGRGGGAAPPAQPRVPLKGAGIALGSRRRAPRAVDPRRAPLASRGQAGPGPSRSRPQGALGGARSGSRTGRAGGPRERPGWGGFPSGPRGLRAGARGLGLPLPFPAAGCWDRRSQTLCRGRRRLRCEIARVVALPAHPALATGLTPRAAAPALAVALRIHINRACASGLTLQDHSLVNCSPFVWDGSPPGTAGQGLTLSTSLPPSLPSGRLLSASRHQVYGPFRAPERLLGGPGAPEAKSVLSGPKSALEGGRMGHSANWHPNSCVQGVRGGGPHRQQLPWLLCIFLKTGFPPGDPAHLGGSSPLPTCLVALTL